MRTFLIFIVLALLLAVVAARLRPAVPALYPTYMSVSSPPLSIEESLASFQLADDSLQITCAAMQPMVEAPVAAQFDERGRLWVVEMRTYMPDIEGTGELEKSNRISILEDTDHDGDFDKSTIFMDDLLLPRGVAPCFDGALVIEPPNLLFCRDTDGDGKADERTILATDFAGLESPEHAGNGLLYGVDGWYHCSQHKEEFRIGIENRGMPQQKITIEKRQVPGHIGQWGITQDLLGRLYYTPNSNPLIVDLYPKFWASLNPNMPDRRGIGVNIAPTDCWPIHPTPGANRGYQPDTLRKDLTLANATAACGPIILTDSLLGDEYEGNAFVCEAVGNLVKRYTIKETAEGPRASHAYKAKEFLASTDERFRPVNTVEGPDGSLYVIDMYRGVIQHKTFETNYLKDQYKKRNLETPLNMGRIWRISRRDAQPIRIPDLSIQSPKQLTENLSSSNSWLRLQSLRLINRPFFGSTSDARPQVSPVDWNALKKIAMDPGSPSVFPACLMILEKQNSVLSVDEIITTPAGRLAFAHYAVEHPESGMVSQFEAWSTNPPEPILIPYIAAGFAGNVQYDALFSFLAGKGDTASARSAALSFLHKRETEALQLALAHSQSAKLKPFVLDLFSCTLNASIQEREQAIDLIAKAPDSLRNDLLNRLNSNLRIGSPSPRTINLPAEPTHFVALKAGESETAKTVSRIIDHLSWPGKPIVIPPVRPLTDEELGRFNRGKELLYPTCATCHQADGRGAPGQAPSLAGSAYVNGSPERLVKILLHGMQGPYEVNGQRYEGAMPVPPGVGSDADIANILTYIRRSFGNTADPVDQQTVSKVRKQNAKRYKAWTRQELDQSR